MSETEGWFTVMVVLILYTVVLMVDGNQLFLGLEEVVMVGIGTRYLPGQGKGAAAGP